MKEKKNLRRTFAIIRYAVTAVAAAVLVIVTAMTAKFCYNFFVYGLFGNGESSELLGGLETSGPVQTDPDYPAGPQTVCEVSRATVTVAGDVMMHIPVIKSGSMGDSTYNYDSVFSYVKDYVNHADYGVLNLETTLGGTDNGNEYSGYPRFNCPDGIVGSVKNAGFDMFLTANNHANDTGAAGFRRTYSTIRSGGMQPLGTTENPADPKYQIVDVNGIKIGMICYTHGKIDSTTGRPSINDLPLDDSVSPLINVFDYEKLDSFYGHMAAHIAGMREDGAEAIVLYLHWGDQYSTSVSAVQSAIAQKMCDLGVDVIAGGHPHAVEPVSMLTSTLDPGHKTLCLYSLGNFLSNQRHDNIGVDSGITEDGMLFSFTFVKYSNGEVHLDSADILPTWVYLWFRDDKKAYTILPLDVQISDWQARFGIDASTESEARNSYSRTMSVIGDGLTAVQSQLSQDKIQRESAFAAVS